MASIRDAYITAKAGNFMRRPFLIAEALGYPAMWPVDGKSAADLLTEARAMKMRRWQGTSDEHRCALEAAVQALNTIIAEGGRLPSMRDAR